MRGPRLPREQNQEDPPHAVQSIGRSAPLRRLLPELDGLECRKCLGSRFG